LVAIVRAFFPRSQTRGGGIAVLHAKQALLLAGTETILTIILSAAAFANGQKQPEKRDTQQQAEN